MNGGEPRCGASSMPGDPTLRVRTEERPEGLLVRLAGDVDLSNYLLLIDAMQPALEHGRDLILDVSGVRYMDSSGVRAVIDADQRLGAARCRLVMVGPPPMLARVLEVIDLPRLLPVVPTVEDAARLLAADPDPPPRP
jgi:anti-anti-sigma factor